MGRGASLSLIGLYNWDDTLFDGMSLPEDWDNSAKDILINNLVMDCGELEVLYSDWDFMKSAIAVWSAKEVVTWQRLYNAMLIEYDPIQNYNRVEKTNTQNRGAMTHSGTDSVQGSGNDSDAWTGYDSDVSSGGDSVTNLVTSFDNDTLATRDKAEETKGTTMTYNKGTTVTHNHGIKDTTTYGHTITDSTGSLVQSEISGNIGVTTSQQMLESELELAPKLNVMNYIIESFKNRFCLLVY